MNKITHYAIILFGWITVLYPIWLRLQSVPWALDSSLAANLFPFFGLIAFTLLWLHALSGAFEPFLRKHINFDRFVHITSTTILISILLHPLLLLVSLRFNIPNLFFYYGVKFVLLGIFGWVLLLTYDIGKALKRYEFFTKHWNNILIISNIGFVITFFHSLYLGSDLQSGFLRTLWIFYGITAIIALIYTYAIKPWLNRGTN